MLGLVSTLLLPLALTGYVVLSVAFLIAARQASLRARLLGIAAIAAAAPFFLVLGIFFEQFGSGQCYSRSIAMIANAVEKTQAPVELAQRLRALPLHGYETVCSEVEAASEKLPNARAP